MNEELFGELHEQEEYGLFGKEHERQQCFLYGVSFSEAEVCVHDWVQQSEKSWMCNKCGDLEDFK